MEIPWEAWGKEAILGDLGGLFEESPFVLTLGFSKEKK